MVNPLPFPPAAQLVAQRSLHVLRRSTNARLRLRRRAGARAPARRGWSDERKARFLAALSRHDTVSAAAAAVRATREQALAQRNLDQAFARAWDEAANATIYQLETVLLDRAIHGVAEPIVHAGARVAERRRYNDALGMWILSTRLPERYARRPAPPPGEQEGAAGHTPPPAGADDAEDADADLDLILERIARRVAEAERALNAVADPLPDPSPDRDDED